MSISLENSNSIIIGSEIKIEIVNDYLNPQKIGKNAIMKIIKYSKKDKKTITNEVIIDERTYNKICTELLNLSPKDIMTESYDTIDGNSTSLTFSSENSSINYSVYGLESAKINSKLFNLKQAVISIFNAANESRYGFNK